MKAKRCYARVELKPETKRKLLTLAKAEGWKFSEFVRIHLEAVADGKLTLSPHRAQIDREKLEDIVRRVQALPTLDDRPEDEILGYDSQGIPR